MIRPLTTALIAIAALIPGCRSGKPSQEEVLAAQQALLLQQQQALLQEVRGPVIHVLGDVERPTLPWNEELSVATAILEANYLPRRDPRRIVVRRGLETLEIRPSDLLRGTDYWLEPGDIIEIRP